MNTQEEIQNRIENFYKIDVETWSSVEEVGPGIFVYHDLVPLDAVKKVEDVINSNKNSYSYREAMVGYGMKMPEYRDCMDFKYKKTDIEGDRSVFGDILSDVWDELYYKKLQAVKHYSHHFRIGELRYWESMNFVKYEPGQHFQEHHDHGYSYNCVVSLVGYPNDDYDGGEINFRLQNLTIKPKAGDLFIFPSNFMYPHRAMPVKNGTKYSIVTMLDYSDKYHKPNFYLETGM